GYFAQAESPTTDAISARASIVFFMMCPPLQQFSDLRCPLKLHAGCQREGTKQREVTSQARARGLSVGCPSGPGVTSVVSARSAAYRGDPVPPRAAHRLEEQDRVEVALPLRVRVAEERLPVQPLRVEHLQETSAPRGVRLLRELQRRLRRRHCGVLGAQELRVVLQCLQYVGDLAERQEHRLPVCAELRRVRV